MSDPVPSIRHQGIVQQSTEGEDIQHLMNSFAQPKGFSIDEKPTIGG